jgi:hypothetical protein
LRGFGRSFGFGLIGSADDFHVSIGISRGRWGNVGISDDGFGDRGLSSSARPFLFLLSFDANN